MKLCSKPACDCTCQAQGEVSEDEAPPGEEPEPPKEAVADLGSNNPATCKTRR